MVVIGLQGAKPLDWGAGHISAAFPPPLRLQQAASSQ